MTQKRQIEIFTAGCPLCQDVIDRVTDAACDSCRVEILDMTDATVAVRARKLGVRSAPAVVLDGRLANCCAGGGVDMDVLRQAGLGQPI